MNAQTRCFFCGEPKKCDCCKLPPLALDLAKFVQQEIHNDHLPGYYFSPKDVYDILEKFFGKEKIANLTCEAIDEICD